MPYVRRPATRCPRYVYRCLCFSFIIIRRQSAVAFSIKLNCLLVMDYQPYQHEGKHGDQSSDFTLGSWSMYPHKDVIAAVDITILSVRAS